jgi:hypothetical protein
MDIAKADELGATSVVGARADDSARIAALKDLLTKAIADQPTPKRQLWIAALNRGDESWLDVFHSLGIKSHLGKRWLRELREVIYSILN